MKYLFIFLIIFGSDLYAATEYDPCTSATYSNCKGVDYNYGDVDALILGTNKAYMCREDLSFIPPQSGCKHINYKTCVIPQKTYWYPAANAWSCGTTCPAGQTPQGSGVCRAPCPTGQHWDDQGRFCVSDCEEPESHPCDFYDSNKSALEYEKYSRCMGRIEWSQSNCQYQHKDGCITSDGYSGPFGGYLSGGPGAADLGKITCILGCEYVFDEYIPETGSLHSSITNLSCGNSVAVPSENYVEEIIEHDDSAWAPDNDLDSGTNCGEFNGEYVCVDTVEDGQCVTTPGGSYVCVSPPNVIPDTPSPLTPDIRIRNPGENPIDPGDDDYVDYYKKPPAGTIPQCPTGSTYVNGQCVRPPDNGVCPTGYTLYGDKCVLDKDLGGPFSGPSGGLGGGLGDPPDFSYYDSLTDMFDSVRNSPLLDFAPNCSSSASCPTLSVLGTSTRIHCDLAEDAVPIFNAFLWLVAGLVAIRSVFSA